MSMRTYQIDTPIASMGNTEWWTERDWEEHRRFMDQITREGRLDEVVRNKVVVEECPIFDKPSPVKVESIGIVILDFNNGK